MSYEKERTLLNDLCNQIAAKGLVAKTITVPYENIFSVLDIIGKELPYCRVLVHLIKNNWRSFEEIVLKKCCEGEALISAETEFQCKAPCRFYTKEGRMDLGRQLSASPQTMESIFICMC